MALLYWLRCQCSGICKTVAQKICVVVLWKWMWCATRKVSLWVVHMIWAGGCCGGVLLCHWLGEGGGCPAGCAFPLSVDPHLAAAGGGLRLHHSPPSSPEGDLASGIPHSPRRRGIWPPAFPTPLPRGPLQQLEKSSQSAIWRPVFFLYPSLRLQKQAFDARAEYKKSPQALLESFFSVVAVRGGFEPPVRLPVRQFSKLVVSATHPSHLSAQWVRCLHKRFGTANIC